MKRYLYDKEFLLSLDSIKNKETYSRITALSKEGVPQGQLEGMIVNGSINIDGKSAVRRTSSLTFATLSSEDEIVKNKYWSYGNRYKLEIGLKNSLAKDKYLDDILWFDQGVYVINSFSTSQTAQGVSVSISGKDKMCLLNGEIAGHILVETDFGTEEVVTRNAFGNIESVSIKKIPLKQILTNVLTEFAGERIENIVINDLDIDGFELWQYRGTNPVFLLFDENKKPKLLLFNNNIQVEYNGKKYALKNFPEDYLLYINAIDPNASANAKKVTLNGKKYYVSRFTKGETMGYHQIEMVYNTELVLKAGETFATLFDKIKNMLGNYEYFYDLQGRFVFQRKNDYAQELFSPVSGKYNAPTVNTTPYAYRFENTEFITQISDPIKMENIKNDFTIWGSRKSISGGDLPIHARYVIQKKPTSYKSPYSNKTYRSTDYDWRELIYQMANDYYKYKSNPNFHYLIEYNNSWAKKGITNFEQYYLDIISFWRQLYNPSPTASDIAQHGNFYDSSSKNKYWNKQVIMNPSSLNFWFDFLDLTGSEYENYSVDKIGTRSKVLNENTLKSICYKSIPTVLFTIFPEDANTELQQANKSVMQLQESDKFLFSRSTQGLSIVDKMNELFETHTIATSTISITTTPIYYLQPNTRIYVEGHGDYTISSLSYTLGHSGTMSISGVKINPYITTA